MLKHNKFGTQRILTVALPESIVLTHIACIDLSNKTCFVLRRFVTCCEAQDTYAPEQKTYLVIHDVCADTQFKYRADNCYAFTVDASFVLGSNRFHRAQPNENGCNNCHLV